MARKILILGGTGTISTSVTAELAADLLNDVTVVNRGHKTVPADVKQIIADLSAPGSLKAAVGNEQWDAVIDFLVYDEAQARERVEVFSGRVKQYIFISTVVAFNHEDKVWINEETEQGNKYSAYGQKKQAAEILFRRASAAGFPVTIVRPSQTYGFERIPLSVKGRNCWSVVSRIQRERPVIVHGDGKSFWHMMHTTDFARNFVKLVGNSEALGRSVNLVNPASVTWDMIYHEIGRQLGVKVKLVHISSDTLACSQVYNNLEAILGDKQYANNYSTRVIQDLIPDFRCTVDYKKGISMYLDYMNAHPEKKEEDPDYDKWCDGVCRDYMAFMRLFRNRH
jgi:nucleoside-diphosphate-sugar epimerase